MFSFEKKKVSFGENEIVTLTQLNNKQQINLKRVIRLNSTIHQNHN